MKTPRLLIACILLASSLSIGATEHAPTIRISDDWIVVSGFKAFDLGPLPWTYAIKKAKIMSVCIQSDYSAIRPADGSKPKNYDGASAEEIAALPAYIEITTEELDREGNNKTYQLPGLTNGTAPAFLQKIIDAAKKSGDSEGTK